MESNPPRVFSNLHKSAATRNLHKPVFCAKCKKLHQTAVFLSLIVTKLFHRAVLAWKVRRLGSGAMHAQD